MLLPSSTGWPMGYIDPWQMPQPPGGVAPLRHDLALARYLEKRKAYDASMACRFNSLTAVIDLCVTMRAWLTYALKRLTFSLISAGEQPNGPAPKSTDATGASVPRADEATIRTSDNSTVIPAIPPYAGH
jgi:hypothetical protein